MWNNRIVEFGKGKGLYFQVCEVFYNDAGVPNGYAAIDDLVADSPQELIRLVDFIHRDLHRGELDKILIADEL